MSEMISVASGFQYSVNIAYDLNNDDKLKNFIPTKSAMRLLEETILSTLPSSNDRARILIGAYGKGKSHIVLMILSMLMRKDLELFEKTLPIISESPALQQAVQTYYNGNNRILPVVITGSNTSIPQAFLLGLQRTLAENNLLDIMPETNYQAAVAVINRWEKEYPSTYIEFEKKIEMPVSSFISALQDFDVECYQQFEKVYPLLTSGSIFNPFLGFDVAELYNRAAKGLRSKGYSGLYVVYDEFSKYLESNIATASVSDTKMLQDFAEMCNRSGDTQMHLLLISHKEISNYIDVLPKQKVDGWRGVSERFRHIHLNNNFAQTYEIISTVIQKDSEKWVEFVRLHEPEITDTEQRYHTHPVFSDVKEDLRNALIEGCYPLHPISTYILPRLSERVAQNERTLFTFLSANGVSTLPSFLKQYDDASYATLTPDVIYDYFEPLLQKEVYGSELHQNYVLTNVVLEKLHADSLECKIVKSISLIYMLAQFEKLKPTKDEIVAIYSGSHQVSEIEHAIQELVEKEFVVYLKRSNNFLRLKQSTGVDVRQKIQDSVALQTSRTTVKTILNGVNFDNYMYPSRYNDDREITRYFSFEFISSSEITPDVNWDIKSSSIGGDGVIYGILPSAEENLDDLKNDVIQSSAQYKQVVFILPRKYNNITAVAKEYAAVKGLRDAVGEDSVLAEEYEMIFDDLQEVLTAFIADYTHPEKYKSFYINEGDVKPIRRKAALTGLLSDICEHVYSDTPAINNEAINRNEITSIANNSRSKIISGLLRNELEPNLGLVGSGQEVSIMRSTLLRTGVLLDSPAGAKINLCPADKRMANLLKKIEDFVTGARAKGRQKFSDLFNILTRPEHGIGLKTGLIPIYMAAVLHEHKQEAVIFDRFGEVQLTTDVLLQISADPGAFELAYIDWNPEKEAFIVQLSRIFSEFIVDAEKSSNHYDYVSAAMRRWYMSLPKYAKESKRDIAGVAIDKRYSAMLRLLKQNSSSQDLLFEKLPVAFGYTSGTVYGLNENIAAAKLFYDEMLPCLKKLLTQEIKQLFLLVNNTADTTRMSMASVITDWCESLHPAVFDQIFRDGTDKCLGLFKSVTNDEETFISRLAKLTTGLRVEDWDEATVSRFFATVKQYKITAESYTVTAEMQPDTESVEGTNGYKITFVDGTGIATTKQFERVETSGRGKLLYNQITSALKSMGHSISEAEKRQILMNVLKELC